MTELRLNGRNVTVSSPPTRPLLEVLRDEVGDLTPKPGCLEGRCGACTVHLDGDAVASCMVTLGRAADHDVTTLEGLGEGDGLDAVQRAFVDTGAMQCGICTPGMLLRVHAMAAERRAWDRAAIQRALVNNLCRCTGYTKILDAVEDLLVGGR